LESAIDAMPRHTLARVAPDERRERLLSAAREIFLASGLKGARTKDVAERAGVSRATIYRRYPSKVDLIVEAGGCLASDDIAFPDTGNLRDDLRGLARSLVTAFKDSPAGRVMPVMIFERRRYPELDAGYRKFLSDRKARTRRVLQRAVERGELPSDTDVGVMSSMLVGPIFHRLIITQEPLNDAFVDALVDALLRGFGATS